MHEQYKEMKCGRDSARTLWIHLFITDMNSICSILTHFTEFKGLWTKKVFLYLGVLQVVHLPSILVSPQQIHGSNVIA